MSAVILRLPNELLFSILHFSQPENFESLMMSCKQIYSVGFPIIEEHNTCKAHSSTLQVISTWDFFSTLVGSPAHLQTPFLSYFTDFVWDCDAKGKKWFEWQGIREIILQVMSKAPRLQHQILSISQEISSLDFSDLADSGVNFDMKMECCECDLDIDVHTGENSTHSAQVHCYFCEVMVLLLLPNIKRLQLKDYPPRREICDQPSALSAIVHASRGRTYLQQLEELCVNFRGFQAVDPSTLSLNTLWQLSPFLRLPRLKSLQIGYLPDNRAAAPIDSTGHFESLQTDALSNLEKLGFYLSRARTSDLDTFLAQIIKLTDFVWEDITPGPHPFIDKYDNDFEANLEYVIRDEKEIQYLNEHDTVCPSYIEPALFASDFGEEEEMVKDNDNLDKEYADDMPDAEHEQDYWNPRRLVEILLRFSNTLERLVLTVDPTSYKDHFIYGHHQVADFKAFTKLRYLELSPRILRRRKTCLQGRHSEYGIPLCLTQILPASIETVVFIADHPEYPALHALLKDLPARTHELPNFHTISVQFTKGSEEWRTNLYPSLTRKRLEPLVEELRREGFTIHVDEYKDYLKFFRHNIFSEGGKTPNMLCQPQY
ncbi:hypothetical protein BT63DRAFT_417936 [Microthyrium microscopicum]|uniref:F-box domain-containing protein n=1 Tax=Microthyrium microscopicum TaxID=703497 RepID=A0A6A6TXZ4_9PEZI|nr:hypothetical protein BT63DRAFT_417936 [Microthyrium microscopicum]